MLNKGPKFRVDEINSDLRIESGSNRHHKKISPEARMLLKAAVKADSDMCIYSSPDGYSIQIGNRDFGDSKDKRRAAVLEGAVAELRISDTSNRIRRKVRTPLKYQRSGIRRVTRCQTPNRKNFAPNPWGQRFSFLAVTVDTRIKTLPVFT